MGKKKKVFEFFVVMKRRTNNMTKKYLTKFNAYANELYEYVFKQLKADYEAYVKSDNYEGTFEESIDLAFYSMGSDGKDYGRDMIDDFFTKRLGNEYDELCDEFDSDDYFSLNDFLWDTYIDERLRNFAFGKNNG